MVVAKRQWREKPEKIEQMKVWGLKWGPQVEQTAPLAGLIYIGQAQGEEKKHKKEEPKGRGSLSCVCVHSLSLFSSCLLGQHAFTSWRCIFLYFLNKTKL